MMFLSTFWDVLWASAIIFCHHHPDHHALGLLACRSLQTQRNVSGLAGDMVACHRLAASAGPNLSSRATSP